MFGSFLWRAGRGVGSVRRFSPRLEVLDGRMLPGGLAGGVLTSGAFIVQADFDAERPDILVLSNRDSDLTPQHGSKPGGTTDGVPLMGQVDLLPGSKPGGTGEGIR